MGATHDVPITIIAHDPARVETDLGWKLAGAGENRRNTA